MSENAPVIMIIRHGEKPPDSGLPSGITEDGTQDPESLIPRGWQRAGALVQLFAPTGVALRAPLSTPQKLYASAYGHGVGHSKRPQQTITPLATKLGIQIESSKGKGDEIAVATEAMRSTGPVLICWQHEDILAIAQSILGSAATLPVEWPGDRYDVVFLFSPDQNGKYSFSQTGQLLLAGDSAIPI